MKNNKNTGTNDIAGYVNSKLYLVNILTENKFNTLFEAKVSITKNMAGIINKLSHSELDYLIERIENII